MSFMRCENCERQVDTDHEPMREDGWCDACHDANVEAAFAKYKPLYDAWAANRDAYKALGYDIENAADMARALKDASR
jgi:hypothetical protein